MIIAVGVLAVLIVAYIAVRLMPPGGAAAKAEEKPTITVTDFERDRIRRIELQHGERSITLVRQDDTWTVEGLGDIPLKQSALEDIVYSVSRLRAERLITEEPENLASFGLENPAARAVVTLEDGSSEALLLGSKAPSGYAFYLKKEGENAVYTVSGIHGQYLSYTMNDLREKNIPSFDGQNITYLLLRSGEEVIEIREMAENEKLYENTLGRYAVTRPYRIARGVDSQKLGELMQEIPAITVKEFIEDDARDLSSYGLDPAMSELHVRDREGKELHILFGSQRNEDSIHARLAGERQVFTVDRSTLDFLRFSPFEIVGKFALIVSIDDVSGFDVVTPEATYRASIERKQSGEGENREVEETYFVDGRTVEEDAFKKYYQRAIGLLVDAENPGPKQGRPEVSIIYHLKGDEGKTLRVDFVPYNRDFYSVYRDGISEFLISRKQVGEMVDAARDLSS